jgi:hypothetical protein
MPKIMLQKPNVTRIEIWIAIISGARNPYYLCYPRFMLDYGVSGITI